MSEALIRVIPNKLKCGDDIRVVALSGSLARVWRDAYNKALSY